MTELLTAAQMRAIERAAIDAGEVTGLELMERAGRGVVGAIFEEWPELRATSHRAVVLCGPGNNGGDGFVVARLLKEWGWEVEVFLYGDPEKLPPDARVNWERWGEIGSVDPLVAGALRAATDRALAAEHERYNPKTNQRENFGQNTIFVDALFGTGLARRFDDLLLEVLGEWSEHCYQYGVAIDMPSGLCSDSGKCVGGDWVFSRILVTFEARKVGHYLGTNQHDIDRIETVPLNIGTHKAKPSCSLFESWTLKLDPTGFFGNGLNKPLQSHKYTHGHALILSGPSGQTGAARLAARGALRIGAGLVTVAAPPEAMAENAAHLTAVMLRPLADADALTGMLEDPRLNAICLGPGLGVSDRTRALVAAALDSGRSRVVLDADALTAFEDDPGSLFAHLHKRCVLTPHAGEFARLFPDIAEKLDAPPTEGPAYSKVDATRAAAARAGCTVLFTGPDTVIADQTGAARINSAHYDRAAPWLATAGSGDVLAGFITGLLARSFDPLEAASTAAWLHVECALSFGPGLIAEDLPEALPGVFRKLGL